MAEPPRYRLHAYIDQRVEQSLVEGWMTTEDIFNWRSRGFAVVEDTTGAFHVWDLTLRALGRVARAAPIWSGPSADAAVMWAVHHDR